MMMPAGKQYWKMFNFDTGKVLEFLFYETVGTLFIIYLQYSI